MAKKLLLCLFSLTLCAEPEYSEQAREWVREYVTSRQISEQDKQYLTDLVHFSYLRSATSIQIQQQALNLMNISWQNWQNVAQTRMDPAHNFPYPTLSEEDLTTMRMCFDLQKQYTEVNKRYAQLCELVLKKNVIVSKKLMDGIKKMRHQARTVVAQSLLDVKSHMHTLIHKLKLLKSPEQKKSFTHISKKHIPDFLMSFLPALGAQSFIDAERSTHVLSEESWKILSSIQALNSYLWHMLETQRAAFYQAYYQELCAVTQ